jgi:hypothetical protein
MDTLVSSAAPKMRPGVFHGGATDLSLLRCDSLFVDECIPMFRTVCCIFSVVVVVVVTVVVPFLAVVLLKEILRVSKLANAATPPSLIQDVPSCSLGGDTGRSESFCGIRQVSIQMFGKLLKLRSYHISFYVSLYSSTSRGTRRCLGLPIAKT